MNSELAGPWFLAVKSRSELLDGTFWAVFAWTFPMLREVPF